MSARFTGVPVYARLLPLLTALALGTPAAGRAQPAPSLLARALRCELRDAELASLLTTLAAADTAFHHTTAQYGAPTANVYRLAAPVTVRGFTSDEVVITPARILLAVPGKTVSDAVRALRLTPSSFSPASRDVRPSVSIVAFTLSHQQLAGKLLVGCEYAHADAAAWAGDGTF